MSVAFFVQGRVSEGCALQMFARLDCVFTLQAISYFIK